MGQPNPDAEWLAQHGTVEELRQNEGYLGGLLPGGNVADLGFHMLPWGGLKLAKRLIAGWLADSPALQERRDVLIWMQQTNTHRHMQMSISEHPDVALL